MRINWNLIALVVISAVSLGGAILFDQFVHPKARDISLPVTTRIATPAPSLNFEDRDGKAYSLTDFKGRGVIINFWATWCTPCRVEMPQLFDLAHKNPNDLTLLLVSVDSDPKAIDGFFDQAGLKNAPNIVVVHDPKKAISKDIFGTLRYPESILIDQRGMMVEKIAGAVDWTTMTLDEITK